MRVRGELDLCSGPALKAYELNGYDRILLDLSGVEFMDATGLHALEDFVRAGRIDHRIEVGPKIQPQVRRLMELAGAEDLVVGDIGR